MGGGWTGGVGLGGSNRGSDWGVGLGSDLGGLWEHANKVLIKVIGKFVKLPQLFHFFVVNDLH